MPPGEDHVSGAGGGLFNKIKRYSNVSHKLMRRSGNSSGGQMPVTMIRKRSPHRTSSGSYDMTGDSSRDLRPEIGAPILITTTALDIDKITPIMDSESPPPVPQSVIPVSSSDSDTEIYADASTSLKNFGSIKFSFFDEVTSAIAQRHQTETGALNSTICSSDDGDYEVVPSPRCINNAAAHHNVSLPAQNAEEFAIKAPLRKNRSKSTSNLDISAGMGGGGLLTVRQPVSTTNLSDGDNLSSGYYNDVEESDKENSAGVFNRGGINNGKTDDDDDEVDDARWNANMVSTKQSRGGNSNEQEGGRNDHEFNEFKRSLSTIIFQQVKSVNPNATDHIMVIKKDVVFVEEPIKRDYPPDDENDRESDDDNSAEDRRSESSLSDDFDFKSASFDDLPENPEQGFMSVEEFNELTRQINESEDFTKSIDLEYCDHRSNLRPNERRVTLMRNKNNGKIHLNLNEKKEKITNAWSGLKHWFDEERGKIKEVVQRHAAMQRVGANQRHEDANNANEEAARDKNKRRRRSSNLSADQGSNQMSMAGHENDVNHDLDPGNDDHGRMRSEERGSEQPPQSSSVFHTILRQKSKLSNGSTTGGGAGGGSGGRGSGGTAAEEVINRE